MSEKGKFWDEKAQLPKTLKFYRENPIFFLKNRNVLTSI